MTTWDAERVTETIMALDYEEIGTDEARDKIVELLTSVRAEAINWTWQKACQQHDQGRDPRKQPIAELLEQALADLNPERGK